METSKLACSLEAVLFAAGEPIDAETVADALGADISGVRRALDELRQKYSEGSGIELLRLGDRYQLSTKKEYAEDVRSVLAVKKNSPLSAAAFEVLAVIAYNQPVTKAFVEQVRGVDSSGVIGTLCQKKLIEECGRLDLPGRPLLYCTTDNFLRCFQMASLADLPDLPERPEAQNEETAQE
ncbi:MAG: SMC-Scp complex subunit ScpB [Clostridia bacterium]|nr:SMC-Scp complex subunit ScpB [Clostridia bacterium]